MQAAAAARCCCSRLHACTHGLAGEGEGEGPAFSPSDWPFAAAARPWQATQCYPTAESGFQSLLLLSPLPLPLLPLPLPLLLLISMARVVSWLGGWVARRVVSALAVLDAPRFPRYKQP